MSQMTRPTTHARNTDEDAPVLTEAEREASRRKLHDFHSFWRVCTLKGCKRGKGCRGDVEACAARHFPMLPDDAKAWLHKAFTSLLDGLSPQEAADTATKHVAAVNACWRGMHNATRMRRRRPRKREPQCRRRRRRAPTRFHRHAFVQRCA
jgi:hypothetical protein